MTRRGTEWTREGGGRGREREREGEDEMGGMTRRGMEGTRGSETERGEDKRGREGRERGEGTRGREGEDEMGGRTREGERGGREGRGQERKGRMHLAIATAMSPTTIVYAATGKPAPENRLSCGLSKVFITHALHASPQN